jgi:hypothetical protein
MTRSVRKLTLFAMVLGLPISSAHSSIFDEETRFALDLSSRINLNQVNDQSSMLHFAGIDFFRTFQFNGKDIGSLLLQPYLVRAVHLSPHPGLFDDPNDTAVQFRNLLFRTAPIFGGTSQLSIGHLELPFGLEREFETNQTLQQFDNQVDGGHKVDWGLGLDGFAGKLKYDVTLTRGSGNEWRNDDSPYLLTVRLGSDPSEPYSIGLTLVDGELWTPAGTTSSRSRYAIDGRWGIGPLNLKGQYAKGKNQNVDAKRSFLELEWIYGYNEWVVYAQRKSLDLGNMPIPQTSISLGVRFEPTNWLQIDLDSLRDQENMGRPKRDMIRAQVRFRLQ